MEATLVAQLVGLLLVAFVVGLIASRLFVPYTVALLVVGIAIGFTHLLDGISLTADTILLVFLPALLFESAINLDLQQLRAATLPIALLAVVGVGVTIAIIGGLFAVSTDLPIMLCILLASTLSATDPVSVLAIFRRIGVPKRLEMVIEGESLFNDGTALVAFQITLAAVQAPASASIGQGLVQFVFVVAGGLLLGAVAGFAISHLLTVTQDHLFEMGISTVLAYGSYLAGQLLHVSPVITVVVAGVIVGNYGRQVGLSDRAKVVLNDIWEYLAFIANTILFVLLGQQLQRVDFGRHLFESALAVALVLATRAVIIYGLAPIVSVLQERVPFAWRHVAFWGGLRGALTVAMVLSLPQGFPFRDTLVSATFATVLFTVLVQGITMEHVVRWLGVREAPPSTRQGGPLQAD